MDGLLTAVKTINRDSESPLVAVETQTRNDAFIQPAVDLSQDISSQQLVQILTSHPGSDELAAALAALDPFNKSRKINELDIRIPGPTTAQILQILVSTTIPDHWASLNGKDSKAKDAKCRAALLRCLSSIAGIGSLVAQLRTLIASSRAATHKAEGSNNHLMIRDLLSVVAALLEPKDFLSRIYTDIVSIHENRTRQQVAWREFVSLVAAGKILSTAAEAITVANASEPISSVSWIGDGPRYATWLGGNIAHLASKIKVDDVNDWTSLAFLTGRALNLGYADQLVREIASELLFEQPSPAQFGLLVDHLRQPEQVAVLEAIFRDVQKKYFSDDLSEAFRQSDASNDVIAGVAALCKVIIADRPFLKDQILGWLSKSQGGSIQTIGLRRALLTIYGDSTDTLKSLLARSLEQFGDKFFIKHVPNITQSTNAQIILLAAGQLNRLDPLQVHGIGRTSVFLNAVSNRLAASSNRARFLGMIVGTGISQLIEEPGKAMKFDLDEMQSEEALWYLSLTTVHDKVGPVESIKLLQKAPSGTQQPIKSTHTSQNQKPSARLNRPQTSKIVAIEEINDSEEESDEDDDLLPYEKPDEDAEDEDEDPTLIQRNKPSAPVYIRDLISYLRDTENVERYHLAISTSPSLIRRKTGFGTELAEQVEELALTLVSLQNDNNHSSFHESRLQSMIALIVSQPLKMGRWFTAIFFDGDLSQVQRSAVLTALGLSAREIAGNGEEDAKALNLPTLGDTSFPSKRLSPALEAVFMGANESPIATLTREMSRTSLQPLAADAADRMTGPNALKVRTFSTRMEVEKKRQQREAQRQKNVVKDVHKVLADGFFYPLQGRFEIMMLQFASSSAPSHNPFFVPHILTLFLQTLSLIFSTAGPHNPSLPGFTHETLSLLLSLHTAPISSEPTVTAALLSLFLAVVDVNIASGSNGEERLVTENATRVMELREWASEVFDRMPSGGGKADSGPFADPQEQVRTLAAGVMVRLGEVIERYQGRLMGVNTGFKY
ncbi:telomere binding protein [Penicillium ochrochloron]